MFNIEEFLPPGSDYIANNGILELSKPKTNNKLFKKKESLLDITKFNVFSPVVNMDVEEKENLFSKQRSEK